MDDYTVTWKIDAECDSPLEAARYARDAQIRPGTSAVVFEVTSKETGETVTIDLDDPGTWSG